MSCWLKCDIKWDPEVIEQKMVNKKFIAGQIISENPFIRDVQRGTCKTCGMIHQREIKNQ